MDVIKDVSKFETANSWYSAMHEKGYDVSILICQITERMMKEEKITFPQAFNQLTDGNRIAVSQKNITLIQ